MSRDSYIEQLAALRELLEAIRDAAAPPRPERREDYEAFDDFQRDRAIAVASAARHALGALDKQALIEVIASGLRHNARPPYETRKEA